MDEVLRKTLLGLKQSGSYRDIHDVIMAYREALGFPYYFYQFWPKGPNTGEVGFTGTFANHYPANWELEYARRDYSTVDPVYHFGMRCQGMVRWSDLPVLSDQQQQMMEHAAQHGLADGVLTVMETGSGDRTGLTFCGPTDQGDYDLAFDTLPIIMPSIVVAFEVAHRTERYLLPLTQREREVFMFWKRYRSRKVIAANLQISERSVYRHLESIRGKVPVDLVS